MNHNKTNLYRAVGLVIVDFIGLLFIIAVSAIIVASFFVGFAWLGSVILGYTFEPESVALLGAVFGALVALLVSDENVRICIDEEDKEEVTEE